MEQHVLDAIQARMQDGYGDGFNSDLAALEAAHEDVSDLYYALVNAQVEIATLRANSTPEKMILQSQIDAAKREGKREALIDAANGIGLWTMGDTKACLLENHEDARSVKEYLGRLADKV